jgi:hypothetical protein
MNHTLYIKLNKDNYTSWKTQILAYLKGQDAYQFIDGTSLAPRQVIPNPNTEPGASATIPNLEFMLWCQKDQMILSILISTLTEQYVTHDVGCVTAHDLWKTLVTMFASQANARVMQIHYQLATTKKGNSSIAKYFQIFKTRSDTLAAAGHPLSDFEKQSFLLAGLGADYDPFVTSVHTRVDPLSIDELFGHLLAHEMQIEQHLPNIESLQLVAHFMAHSPAYRGRPYRGRGSSTTGRGSFAGVDLTGDMDPPQIVAVDPSSHQACRPDLLAMSANYVAK